MGNSLALIDINMGCPAKKIVSNGEGCALMNDPDRDVRYYPRRRAAPYPSR
jgi:tRNA-dihydrouridine synthase